MPRPPLPQLKLSPNGIDPASWNAVLEWARLNDPTVVNALQLADLWEFSEIERLQLLVSELLTQKIQLGERLVDYVRRGSAVRYFTLPPGETLNEARPPRPAES
jgi:hypothetical protein